MKNVLFFLKCFLIVSCTIPIGLLAQDTIPPSDTLTIPPINPGDVSQVILDELNMIWLGAIAIVFPLFTFIGTKWKWAQDNLNIKLISSIVSLAIALIAIFYKGIPPLAVSGVIGIVFWVINTITGSVKLNDGETITQKNKIQAVGKRELGLN